MAVSDQHGEDAHAAFDRLVPRAHRDQHPAVGDRRDGGAVEQRGVEESIHAIWHQGPHAVGEAGSARDQLVRAEPFHQFAVGRFVGDVGDHAQAIGFGQLDDIAAQCAGRPGDCQRLSRLQCHPVEAQPRGECVHSSAEAA